MLLSISSALSWSFFSQVSGQMPHPGGGAPACARFILAQIKNMPDYLRLVFTVLALALNLVSLITERGFFCRVHPDARRRIISRWEKIPGPGRDFMLFYKTLTTFYVFSFLDEKEKA